MFSTDKMGRPDRVTTSKDVVVCNTNCSMGVRRCSIMIPVIVFLFWLTHTLTYKQELVICKSINEQWYPSQSHVHRHSHTFSYVFWRGSLFWSEIKKLQKERTPGGKKCHVIPNRTVHTRYTIGTRARPLVRFHLLENVNSTRDFYNNFIYWKTRKWKILLTSKRDPLHDF